MVDKISMDPPINIEKILQSIPESDKTLVSMFFVILLAIIGTSLANVEDIPFLLTLIDLAILMLILFERNAEDTSKRQLQKIQNAQIEFIKIDFLHGKRLDPYQEYVRKKAILLGYEGALFAALREGKTELATELRDNIRDIKSEIIEIKSEIKD